MKRLMFTMCLCLMGCGYSSVGNNAVCQPKKIHHNTPLICGNYDSVDISLGVMRNGVGSMSTHDMTLAFDPNDEQTNEKKLVAAIKDGKLVNLTYSERRFSWCQEEEQVVSVEVIETTQELNEDKESRKREIQQKIEQLNQELSK